MLESVNASSWVKIAVAHTAEVRGLSVRNLKDKLTVRSQRCETLFNEIENRLFVKMLDQVASKK